MTTTSGLRLNLGCGLRHLSDYVNVDMYGEPDVMHDLESFPWPWADDSVSEIRLVHVLEHLGHSPRVFRDLWKETYRVCMGGARLSQRFNLSWKQQNAANSPLGLYWEVDFEIVTFQYKPSPNWFRVYPDKSGGSKLLLQESAVMNNLVEEITFDMKAIKPPTSTLQAGNDESADGRKMRAEKLS